jgi:hypothetical protein
MPRRLVHFIKLVLFRETAVSYGFSVVSFLRQANLNSIITTTCGASIFKANSGLK